MKCEVCFNEFEPKNTLQKFCSQVCRRKSLTVRNSIKRSVKRKILFSQIEKVKKCLVCDKEFEIRQQFRKQKYCSEQCSKRAERLFGKKRQTDLDYKNRTRYGGNQFNVLERDNYTCQICENTNQLVIHHKDLSGQSDNPNNDMDNLITLCRRCHINIHRNLI